MTHYTIEDLPEAERRELLERTMRPRGQKTIERRKELWARWLAMREKPDGLVRQRIGETFHTPEVVEEVSLWATGIFNPIKRLASLAAQAYTVPPIRTVDGLGQRASRDYLRALQALRFNARCRTWNRWQVAMNTIAVLVKPARRANGDATLDFDKVTGACAEAVPHPEAPFGDTPAILAYSLARDLTMPAEPGVEETIATVDARWWTFWNDRLQVVRVIEHGLGMFPGTVLRSTEPDGEDADDYWDPDFGRATTQALKEAGMAGAIMGWLRKTQFGKLVVVARQDGQAGPQETEGEEGQPFGQPETPVELVNAALSVHDLQVGVEKFREHMGMLLAEAAHAMTGTASILDEPTPGTTQTDTASVHRLAALRRLQGEQVDYLAPFELELQVVMAAMGQRIGVRGLPSPDAIRDGFDVKHAPLTLLGTPSEMMNLAITGTKFGVTDQVEYLMRTEGLSEEDAREKVMDLAERVADLNDLRAKRMSNGDPLEVRTQEVRPELPGEGAAATSGRRGGRASPPPAA